MSIEDDISQAVANKVIYPTSKLSIAALVLGILTIWPLRILTAIPAIICGHLALNEIKKSRGNIAGTGYARFGLIVGYIDVGLLIIAVISAAILLPALSNQVQDAFHLQSAQASGK